MEYLSLLKNIHIMLVVRSMKLSLTFRLAQLVQSSSTELGYELSGSEMNLE